MMWCCSLMAGPSQNQIVKRKDEYPDQIHQVPVECAVLQQDVVFGVDGACPRLHGDPCQKRGADHHMQSVNAGGHEIETEEYRLSGRSGFQMPGAGIDAMADLGAPLEVLDNHEARGADDRAADQHHGAALFRALHCGYRHGGEEAAGEQDYGIGTAHHPVQLFAGGGKFVRVALEINRIQQKQPAEQQQFGEQEQPHAELCAEIVFVYLVSHGFPTPLKSYGPWVTTGSSTKFSVGGGVGMLHSSVTPPQGFPSNGAPRHSPRNRLTSSSARPAAMIQLPTVD